jgi:hypothetical protein
MKAYVHLWYLALFFLKWVRVQTKHVDKIKTHILSSIYLYRTSSCWKHNVKKEGRTRQATHANIIRCMHFTCCIFTATDTFRIWNTYSFSTAKIVTPKHLNVALYVHCLSSYGTQCVHLNIHRSMYKSSSSAINPYICPPIQLPV